MTKKTLLTALLCVAALAVPHARAGFPGANGPIVFVRTDGDGERARLYVRRNGTTAFLTKGTYPKWSSDGRWLLFARHLRQTNLPLFRMRADGTQMKQITDGSFGAHYGFDWSSDGQRIVYSNGSQIFIMNADGSNAKQLTTGRGCKQEPAWSPDGSTIAYTSFPPRQGGIFLLPTCTGGITDTSNLDISVIDQKGTSVVALTDSPDIQETTPDWSPDGSRILMTCRSTARLKRGRICVLGSQGTGRVIFERRGRITSPVWSPDGRRILFTFKPETEEDNDAEVFVMRRDGTRVRQLTDNASEDFAADWGPR
ncbi:MAG TPA: hypothetical protein VG929_03715 [Actinomycetota bacterium]|nr:hypothetical protein [Actinomycetota bacterium]